MDSYIIIMVVLLIIGLIAKAATPKPKTPEEKTSDFFATDIPVSGNKDENGIYENRLPVLNDTEAVLHTDPFTKETAIKLERVGGQKTSLLNLYTVQQEIEMLSITFQYNDGKMLLSVFGRKEKNNLLPGTNLYSLFTDDSVVSVQFAKQPQYVDILAYNDAELTPDQFAQFMTRRVDKWRLENLSAGILLEGDLTKNKEFKSKEEVQYVIMQMAGKIKDYYFKDEKKLAAAV